MSRPQSDPKVMFKRSLKLLRKSLIGLEKQADMKEGLSARDLEAAISLATTLNKFARLQDEDDVLRLRQVKGMSDEQLEATEKELARKVRSEAAKDAALNKEFPDEPDETP
jgi:hypothetical protein